jgi:hypothetical protein
MTTPPPHDSIELPASIRDLEHWADRFTYRGYAFHELSIFAHAGRMYVCRDEDVEALRAWLFEAAVARWAEHESEQP